MVCAAMVSLNFLQERTPQDKPGNREINGQP